MGRLEDIARFTKTLDIGEEDSRPYYEQFFEYVEALYYVDDEPLIRFDLDTQDYYRYIAPIYVKVHEEEINRLIFEWAQLTKTTLTTSKIKMIHMYLRTQIGIHGDEWDSDPRYIAVRNGVVDLQEKRLLPAHPMYKLTQMFNFSFTIAPRETPYINEYRRLYPEAMETIERFMQSVIRYDLSIRQALFIYGRSGTGKSTLLNAIQKVLGPMSKAGSLKDFNDPKYAYSYLLNSRVMLDKDHRGETLTRDAIEVFLKLVGGDLDDGVLVNMKYRRPFVAKIRMFFIIASNQFARLPSNTNLMAWFRRIRIVQFNKKIEKIDPHFGEKLLSDMDSWFSHLILRDYEPLTDHFDNLEEYARSQQRIWELSSNPAKAFIEEMFEKTADSADKITFSDVMEILKKRFVDENHSIPYEKTFRKTIQETLLELDYRITDVMKNGKRYVVYIKLKEEWEEKFGEFITDDIMDIFS